MGIGPQNLGARGMSGNSKPCGSPLKKISNSLDGQGASPLAKNGKDKDKKKDDFNYKSDMGKYNPTVTSYEGDAFVGKRGGKAQKEGAKVSGVTEGTRGGDNKAFRGKVTGPAKSSKSEQSRRVKGATYSS